MRKRILILLLAAAMCLSVCGCGAKEASDDTLLIVTTVFPVYDWTRVILGEDTDAELVWLLDDGVDLHSYQATAQDLAKIAECDLFIFVGGESEAWADEALAQPGNPERRVIRLMDLLEGFVCIEDPVGSVEPETGEEEYDEHIWLSLQNAQTLTGYIAGALEELDPDHAERCRANEGAFFEELVALKADYRAAAEEGDVDTLVFGDRFPFRYLTDELGLSYYAAFPGCSAETEASFETVLFLAQRVDELGLPAVLTLEGSDGRIAQTVADTCASDPLILTVDSMQSVTAKEAAAGATYLTIMEKNLEVLRQALTVDK